METKKMELASLADLKGNGRGYISITGLSRYGLQLNGYEKGEADRYEAELGIFKPMCELLVMASIELHEDKYSVEYICPCVIYKNHFLRVSRPDWKKKAYRFYLLNEFHHKHDRYFQSEPEPNLIGVPTIKKLDDWLNYLLAQDAAKKAFVQNHLDKENAFIEKLDQLGDLVVWARNRGSGHITKGNLYYRFYLYAGEISESIAIDNPALNLETFLKMADNQYGKS